MAQTRYQRMLELFTPGRGTMMRDALRAAQVVPAFRAALVVHLVEVSPVLRKRQEIPSGHNPADYVTTRIMAKADDGAEVPVSILQGGMKAWRDAEKLGFPLLSDFNKEVIALYGVVNPDMIGLRNIAKRAIFVIDRGGVVRHREVLDDARNEPDYARVRAVVSQLA